MQFLRRFRLFRNLASLPTRQSVFLQSTKNVKQSAKVEAEIAVEAEEFEEEIETIQKRAEKKFIPPKPIRPQFDPSAKFPSPHLRFVRKGSEQSVGRWLYICAGGVLFLTFLNGYARVAHLGLDNKNWKPVYHTYPQDREEWDEEYDNYSKEVKTQVPYERFKSIYNVQFTHKVGWSLLFWSYFGPLLYFRFTRRIRFNFFLRLLGIGFLSSVWAGSAWKGLKLGSNSLDTKSRQDDFRAVFQTGAGMLLYGTLLRNGLATSRPSQTKFINPSNLKAVSNLFRSTRVLTVLLAINMLTGIVLTNKNGGKIFNTWPLMDGNIIPERVEDDSTNDSDDDEDDGKYGEKKSKKCGCTKDIGRVQFYHRVFSYLTYLTTLAIAIKVSRHPVPQLTKVASYSALGVGTYQMANGIYTILNESPVTQSYAHHCSSWIYFTTVMLLAHSVRRPQKSYRLYLKQFI